MLTTMAMIDAVGIPVSEIVLESAIAVADMDSAGDVADVEVDGVAGASEEADD